MSSFNPPSCSKQSERWTQTRLLRTLPSQVSETSKVQTSKTPKGLAESNSSAGVQKCGEAERSELVPTTCRGTMSLPWEWHRKEVQPWGTDVARLSRSLAILFPMTQWMLLKQQPVSRLASNLSLSHITVPFAIELQEVPRVTETTGKLRFFIVTLPFTQDFQETGFIQEDLSCLPPIPRQFRLHVSSAYGENLPASVTEACWGSLPCFIWTQWLPEEQQHRHQNVCAHFAPLVKSSSVLAPLVGNGETLTCLCVVSGETNCFN